MKLKDVQHKKKRTVTVAARIKPEYKKYIDKHKINVSKLLMVAIDELKEVQR